MNTQKRKIIIFDTTLRDGEQSPGASLTGREKVEVAKQLERLNVDVIEAGFPASSKGELEAVQMVSRAVRKPVICGLARMVKSDIDAVREALKFAKHKRLHVFLATSEIHRQYKLRKDKGEILKTIEENIQYAKKYFDDIEFSPEDAARTEPDFLAQAVQTAVNAGATTINIPDTVGYAIPVEFGEVIRQLIQQIPVLGKKVNLSVHCHNDLGLAVANSLEAVRNGANQVECTVNGIGERAGNASLEEIVMAIKTRPDLVDAYTEIVTPEIMKSSRLVSSLTGMMVQANKAIVGKNAFAHESGIHQHGILKKRQTYEILDPKDVGLTTSELVLGKHSGRHAFRERLVKMGYQLNEKALELAFTRFKQLADRKKSVYDEDIQMIIEEEMTQAVQAWQLVSLELNAASGKAPQVKVRLKKAGKVLESTSSGDGPVDACYKAIEKLMGVKARLTHYSIQSVTVGKDAMGEAVVKVRSQNEEVTGRGVSTDIIEASAKAYIKALDMLLNRSPKKRSVYEHP